MVGAMPDNDSGDFLSHDMKPVEDVLSLRVEVRRDLTDGVSAIGEERDLLVGLHALGGQQLDEAAPVPWTLNDLCR